MLTMTYGHLGGKLWDARCTFMGAKVCGYGRWVTVYGT